MHVNQNFFSLRRFFLIRGKCIIENSDVSQWLLLVSFIQNHSAITQLFYMTSSSLKPIVHDLLYSEMLRERNSSPSWKVSQKIFSTSRGDPASPSSAPPYLPTSSYATVAVATSPIMHANLQRFVSSLIWQSGLLKLLYTVPTTSYRKQARSQTFLKGGSKIKKRREAPPKISAN